MNKLFLVLFFLFGKSALSQENNLTALKAEIASHQNDTTKIFIFLKLADGYAETNPDTSFFYADKAALLASAIKLRLHEADAMIYKGYAQLNMGNYAQALKTCLSAIAIAEHPKWEKTVVNEKYLAIPGLNKQHIAPSVFRLHVLGRAYMYTGIVYGNGLNYKKEIEHYLKAKEIFEPLQDNFELADNFMTLGRVYLSLKKIDSALYYEQKAHDLSLKVSYPKHLGSILLNLARVHLARGSNQEAGHFFKRAILASYQQNYLRGVVAGNLGIADIFRNSGNNDSSLYYIRNAYKVAEGLNSPALLLRCYTAFAKFYKEVGNKDSTIKYQDLVIKLNDSLFNSKHMQQFQNVDFEEQQRRKEAAIAGENYRNRLRLNTLIIGLTLVLLIVFILWKNNLQKRRSYAILQERNTELQLALTKLEATQKQLIHSEKMASLGELTAGIAHEIQNPLNFINNFSEVNTELIGELKDQLKTGNAQEALILSDDIKINEQKIYHHGKRADAIVKGMLQHSRSSSGKKEPTDINVLADEYLRLSYHGLRAKDKSFNADFSTDFDESIGKIEVVPQDIGRVLLNLYNNAFYSVNEKKKASALNRENYEPKVSVSTKKEKDTIVISVRDNGTGIPRKVIDKIYQPFFTTKPTGQGTGLGLSMSYDIITKGHGGELKVETQEGEFSEFVIILPF